VEETTNIILQSVRGGENGCKICQVTVGTARFLGGGKYFYGLQVVQGEKPLEMANSLEIGVYELPKRVLHPIL